MASLTMFAGITTGSSFYAKYSDGSSSYLGNYNSSNTNLYARGSYPSPLKYLRENGVVSASQTIKISSAKVSIKRSSGKNGSISLEARINNDNSVGGLTTGTATSITAANASGNTSWVTWTFTDSASLKALLQDTNVVVHIQANTTQSVHYFGFRNLSYNSQDRSIRLAIEYEIVEDSGSGEGGDEGGGDDSGTTTPTVNFNNTSMGSISDIDYGNTLSCAISNIPSNSKLNYKWWFKKPDGSFYLQDSDTTDASDKLVLKWKPDIDVGDYFSSSGKEQIGKLEVIIENPNAGDNKFSGSSYFTVTLTDSFGPTVPIISIGSTHTSGSYIPGSGIIWSASSTAKEKATIEKYTFSINGQTNTVYSSSVKNQIAYILPTNEGTYIATITVTDSRGFTASTTRNITVSSKIAPTINASVIRCDKAGVEDPVEGAYFLLNGTISADQTGGSNYITSVKVEITQTVRDADDKVVTEKRTFSDSPSLTKEYNLSKFEALELPYSTDPEKKLSSFDIVITAIDSKGTPAERILYGPAAAYIIHIAVGGKSLGLGSKAGLDKTITCGWDLISGGNLTVNGSVILKSQPLAVEYGGTGATTKAGARINLGITDAINEAISGLKLSSYVTNSTLTSTLSNYVQNSALNNYVQNSTLNSYALKTEVPKIYYTNLSTSRIVKSSFTVYYYSGNTGPTNATAGDIWLKPI